MPEAQISARAPTKGYVQTGARDRPSLNGALACHAGARRRKAGDSREAQARARLHPISPISLPLLAPATQASFDSSLRYPDKIQSFKGYFHNGFPVLGPNCADIITTDYVVALLIHKMLLQNG